MELIPVFLPGGFPGQRSLAGYSPWGLKESDRTETTLSPSLFKYCSVRKHVPKGMIMQKNCLFFFHLFVYLLFFFWPPKCEGFQLKRGSFIL